MTPRAFLATTALALIVLFVPETAEARRSRRIRVPTYGSYGLRGGVRSTFIAPNVPYRRSYGLSSAPAHGQTARRPSRHTSECCWEDRSTARAVQRSLRAQGYYRGPIDGDVGPMTRRAIKRFQGAEDMETTGEIDGFLIVALGIG